MAEKGTADGRQWWAALAGLIVFIICIVASNAFISHFLDIGREVPFQLGVPPQPDNGVTTAAALGWLAAGFISTLAGGITSRKIAPDLPESVVVRNSIAALVVFALLYLLGGGFTVTAFARAATILVGGVIGIKSA